MGAPIRLDDNLVADAQIRGSATNRSVPKQIEHWASIGQIMEDNPDLSYAFVQEALIAQAEMEAGRGQKYVRREDRK